MKKIHIGYKEIDGITFSVYIQGKRIILENDSMQFKNWEERLDGFSFMNLNDHKYKINEYPSGKFLVKYLNEQQEDIIFESEN